MKVLHPLLEFLRASSVSSSSFTTAPQGGVWSGGGPSARALWEGTTPTRAILASVARKSKFFIYLLLTLSMLHEVLMIGTPPDISGIFTGYQQSARLRIEYRERSGIRDLAKSPSVNTLPGVCLENIHLRFPDTTGDRLHSYV